LSGKTLDTDGYVLTGRTVYLVWIRCDCPGSARLDTSHSQWLNSEKPLGTDRYDGVQSRRDQSGYSPIAHSLSQRPVLKVFPWINQSDIFILNWSISYMSNCNPLANETLLYKHYSRYSNSLFLF